MRRKVLLFLALLHLAHGGSAYPPGTGAVIVLTDKAIRVFGQAVEPLLISTLSNLTIPDDAITTHAFTLALHDIHSSNFKCTDCVRMNLMDDVNLIAATDPFGLTFRMHIVITTPLFEASTNAIITISNGTLVTLVKINPTPGGRFELKVQNIHTSLPLTIEFDGGVSAVILNAIREVLIPYVRGAAETVIITSIIQSVEGSFNRYLATSHWSVPLPSPTDAVANLSLLLSGPLDSTSKLAHIPALATVTAVDPSAQPPPRGATRLSPAICNGATGFMCTAYYDMGTVNQYFFAALATSNPYLITHEMADRYLNSSIATLNTTRMGWLVPGVASAYPDRWMEIVIQANVSAGVVTPHIAPTSQQVCDGRAVAEAGIKGHATGTGTGPRRPLSRHTRALPLPHAAAADIAAATTDLAAADTLLRETAAAVVTTDDGDRALHTSAANVRISRRPRRAAAPTNVSAVDDRAPPLCVSITAYCSFLFNVVEPRGAGTPSVTAFVLGCPFTYTLALGVALNESGVVVHGKVSEPSCSLELVSSDVGMVMVTPFNFLISILDRYITPQVNDYLAAGMVMAPKGVAEVFEATAAAIALAGNGAVLEIGADFAALASRRPAV